MSRRSRRRSRRSRRRRSRIGSTKLFFYKGDASVVKILLKHGASVSAQNINQNTPLHTAAIKKNYDVVQFILKKGGNPGIPNVDGNTPLHYLARGKLTQKLKGILDEIVYGGISGSGSATVGKSANFQNSINNFSKFINYKNNNDETPLFCSVMSADADVSMIEYLISVGASLDVKSKYGIFFYIFLGFFSR